jgi:hypothetical protein
VPPFHHSWHFQNFKTKKNELQKTHCVNGVHLQLMWSFWPTFFNNIFSYPVVIAIKITKWTILGCLFFCGRGQRDDVGHSEARAGQLGVVQTSRNIDRTDRRSPSQQQQHWVIFKHRIPSVNADNHSGTVSLIKWFRKFVCLNKGSQSLLDKWFTFV